MLPSDEPLASKWLFSWGLLGAQARLRFASLDRQKRELNKAASFQVW